MEQDREEPGSTSDNATSPLSHALRKHRASLLLAMGLSVLIVVVYPFVAGGRGSIALPVIAVLMPLVAIYELLKDVRAEQKRKARETDDDADSD